jgi:hypothetical protein
MKSILFVVLIINFTSFSSFANIISKIVFDSDIQENGNTYKKGTYSIEEAAAGAVGDEMALPSDRHCVYAVVSVLSDFEKGAKANANDGWIKDISEKTRRNLSSENFEYEAHFKQDGSQVVISSLFLVDKTNSDNPKKVNIPLTKNTCPIGENPDPKFKNENYSFFIDYKKSLKLIGESLVPSLCYQKCDDGGSTPVPKKVINGIKSIKNALEKQ